MSTVVDKAIRAGKFPESRRAFYERAYARDPEGHEAGDRGDDRRSGPGQARGRLCRRRRAGQRGPIESSAGLPLRPHPMGGYYVERP